MVAMVFRCADKYRNESFRVNRIEVDRIIPEKFFLSDRAIEATEEGRVTTQARNELAV